MCVCVCVPILIFSFSHWNADMENNDVLYCTLVVHAIVEEIIFLVYIQKQGFIEKLGFILVLFMNMFVS